MNSLPDDLKIGDNGIYIPMVGENDLFVPWSVVKRTEEAMVKVREMMDKMPWGIRHLLKSIAKNSSIKESAINTIIETAAAVKQMGGRIVWKDIEYEEHTDL